MTHTYISLVRSRGVAAALDTATAGRGTWSDGPCAFDRSSSICLIRDPTAPMHFPRDDVELVLGRISPNPMHPAGMLQ